MSRRLAKEWSKVASSSPASKAFYSMLNHPSHPRAVSALPVQQYPEEDIILFPITSNYMTWVAYINGPSDSPFFWNRFQLLIKLPVDYPLSPPHIEFTTRIFHPNIDFTTGEICLDILKANWSPSWSLESSCRAVLILLGAPEHTSPLNIDAAKILRNGDMRAYWSLVRFYTKQYAIALPVSADMVSGSTTTTTTTTTTTSSSTTISPPSTDNPTLDNTPPDNTPPDNTISSNSQPELSLGSS